VLGVGVSQAAHWEMPLVNAYLNLGDSNTGPAFSAFSEAPASYLANDSANASNIYDARLSGTITQLIAPASATVTMTIAAPCVVTDTAHGLVAGAPWVGSTTGAFPTGSNRWQRALRRQVNHEHRPRTPTADHDLRRAQR
jgi:hypothetical protein